MEDDVYVGQQRVQHAGDGKVELMEVRFQIDDGRPIVVAEVVDPPAPEVVHDCHLGFEGAQPPHEIRADHAGAPGHEDALARQ